MLWLMYSNRKRQSQPTVLLRTPFTWTIKFHRKKIPLLSPAQIQVNLTRTNGNRNLQRDLQIQTHLLTFSTRRLTYHSTLLFSRDRQRNVLKWKMHVLGEKSVQSVQNHCFFCELNMQICGFFVAIKLGAQLFAVLIVWANIWQAFWIFKKKGV